MRTLTTTQIENLEVQKLEILKEEKTRHEGYSIAYPEEDLEHDFISGKFQATIEITWSIVSELNLEDQYEDVESLIEKNQITIGDSIEKIVEKIIKD